jgi:hypothetical protein
MPCGQLFEVSVAGLRQLDPRVDTGHPDDADAVWDRALLASGCETPGTRQELRHGPAALSTALQSPRRPSRIQGMSSFPREYWYFFSPAPRGAGGIV